MWMPVCKNEGGGGNQGWSINVQPFSYGHNRWVTIEGPRKECRPTPSRQLKKEKEREGESGEKARYPKPTATLIRVQKRQLLVNL